MNAETKMLLDTAHSEQIATLQVFTVPTKATDGHAVIEAKSRNGKNPDGTKREVAECDRYRCIIIPELAVEGVPSKYQSVVIGALYEVAKTQLAQLWEADSALREVPAAIWSVDSLLLYAAREAESKRLTKANLTAWFDASDLCKRLTAKGDAKLLARWKADVISLAAPTLDISEANCNVMIATVGKADADEGNVIGQQIIARLTERIAKLTKQMSEIEEV